MAQTVVEKIAQAHMVEGPRDRPVRSGDFLTIRPHRVMTHDNTAAVMKKFRSIGAAKIADPRLPVFILDHDIQNRSEANLSKYRSIEEFARNSGVDFYPAGSGIGHQIIVEHLYARPGSFVVASDSHSNMYGAVGALGTPVVRTDAAAIWATGEFWWQIPRTVQVVLEGELPPESTGKDIILSLCGLYNQGEVLNAAVEFTGTGIATLGMDARMTIANMTTEWGALVGWFPVDRATLDYLHARRKVLGEPAAGRISDRDLKTWESSPPGPDPNPGYAARIRMDLSRVTPHVTGPDTVQITTPLAEMESRRIVIHKAYLVSCVNSRLEDLEAAARVLKGKKVADSVELYVSAASKEVQDNAETTGAWTTMLEAGAIPLPPGCGPCIGLGAGLLNPGEVGISATNRNFKGRMGSRDAQCYLASPEVVAASAVAGSIRGPHKAADGAGSPEYRFEEISPAAPAARTVAILPGFPERIRGRLLWIPQDNLNTDGIYGKDYTYREDMTPEAMARVVMENYDPEFAGRAKPGDILAGGWNFGTGSSREQAVTSLQARGIALVVAASFSQTYLRNAFNNGLPCITCPDLARYLRDCLADPFAVGEKTVIPGDEMECDFSSGTVRFQGKAFPFPALGTVPQSLVVAGGVENLTRRKLGLEKGKD